MGVSVKDKLSAVRNRPSPASKVSAKLKASSEAKARSLLKGDKGDKGDPGPPGPKGDKGDPGKDGHTPQLGVDYFVINGKNGKDGRDGRNGVTTIIGAGDDSTSLLSATITYTGDLATRIDYAGGEYKILTYNLDSSIDTITWYRTADTVTKTFAYDLSGNLTSVTVTIV